MRKFFKIVGILFLFLVIIVGVGGYFFIKNFDLNKYKAYASQIVEEQIGRKFAINGNASIGISLVPTIILEDVELANADWASASQMVKVNKLELKFALLPLLKKQIVVDKAILINPEVYLETTAAGTGNWEFSLPEIKTAVRSVSSGMLVKAAFAAENEDAEKEKLKALAGFAAKQVSISNGLVQYKAGKNGKVSELVINQVNLSVPDAESDIKADLDVVYDDQHVTAKAVLGSLDALIDNKNPYPVLLDAQAYGVNLNLDGSVADMTGNIRYAVQANVYNPAGNMGLPETTLKTRIDGDLKNVSADINVLNVANNLITGQISADISGQIPSVSADLNSEKIDLTSLMPNQPLASAMQNLSLIGTANAADMVPDTAIPYGLLRSVNAKANVAIADLIIDKGMEAKNVLLNAVVNNGVLNISKLRLDFGDGELDANGVLNGNTESLSFNVLSKNILLQNLHKEFLVEGKDDFGIISGGSTDLQINLSGTGATYRRLVQNLSGQVIAIVNQSVVQTGALNFLTGNILTELLNTLNFSSSKIKQLDLNCAVVRADLSKGKAVFPKGIAVSSKQVSLVSDGSINLINDQLDFSLQPFSGKVADSNLGQMLSSFVKIKGTLQNPKITLDDTEALKAVIGVAATGGTAYLGSKLLLDGNSSPCYTALIGTKYADKFPKPTGVDAAAQDAYQGTTKALGNDLKALKSSAKDLLNMFNGKKGN